jgi:hypothetical protein
MSSGYQVAQARPDQFQAMREAELEAEKAFRSQIFQRRAGVSR